MEQYLAHSPYSQLSVYYFDYYHCPMLPLPTGGYFRVTSPREGPRADRPLPSVQTRGESQCRVVLARSAAFWASPRLQGPALPFSSWRDFYVKNGPRFAPSFEKF